LKIKAAGQTARLLIGSAILRPFAPKTLAIRVKYWMVMNEPAVFTGAGYFLGIHAPGRMGLRNFLPAIHHVVLSIVAGARILRKLVPDAQIGNTFSCSHIEPYADKPKHINAAKRADALINRLFIEPILGLGYPTDEVTALKGSINITSPAMKIILVLILIL
jgi:beta-glucosidase